jgi:phosphosulfolactate synthase (CoM biosynthesis protein A)
MLGPGFLDLPVRSGKPRRTGITHVLDRGIPLAQVSDLLEQNGCYVDVWKLGRGIAYLDPQLAAGDLEAGATWILAEGRASGTVGIYESSGAIRQDVAEALAAAVGPDVNLANVAPDGALGLETFRLSLRADTYRAREMTT